jgi:ferredoxin
MHNDFLEKNISGLTIKIDRTTCIATTNCAKVAPEIFELDDEKIISFKNGSDDIEKERIVEACSVCPVNALYVIDQVGKQIVP